MFGEAILSFFAVNLGIDIIVTLLYPQQRN
jgi:hypothetical protein